MKKVAIFGYKESGAPDIFDATKTYNRGDWIHAIHEENSGSSSVLQGPDYLGSIKFVLKPIDEPAFTTEADNEEEIALFVLDLTKVSIANKKEASLRIGEIAGYLQNLRSRYEEVAIVFSRFEKYEAYVHEKGGLKACLKKEFTEIWNVLDRRNIKILCRYTASIEADSIGEIVRWVASKISSTATHKNSLLRVTVVGILLSLAVVLFFTGSRDIGIASVLLGIAVLVYHLAIKHSYIKIMSAEYEE